MPRRLNSTALQSDSRFRCSDQRERSPHNRSLSLAALPGRTAPRDAHIIEIAHGDDLPESALCRRSGATRVHVNMAYCPNCRTSKTVPAVRAIDPARTSTALRTFPRARAWETCAAAWHMPKKNPLDAPRAPPTNASRSEAEYVAARLRWTPPVRQLEAKLR